MVGKHARLEVKRHIEVRAMDFFANWRDDLVKYCAAMNWARIFQQSNRWRGSGSAVTGNNGMSVCTDMSIFMNSYLS